jgi:hypothetical protein
VADDAARVLRPEALLADAERLVGKFVEIEIVETLSGPPTPELLANAEYGQVRVNLPEGSASDLALVPKSFRLDDPKRYHQRFDRVLVVPLRVRGELLEDAELRHGKRRSYVLRVESAEALPAPPPIPVRSVAELEADRPRFDRAAIELEGSLVSGFEKSALEEKIWLSQSPGARITGTPRRDGKPQRVRVVGTLFAAPGAHYGHLGGYTFQLTAREIEYRP